jgi:hypothetical protein
MSSPEADRMESLQTLVKVGPLYARLPRETVFHLALCLSLTRQL